MLKDDGRPELDYCKHGQQNRVAAVNDDLQMKGSIPLVPRAGVELLLCALLVPSLSSGLEWSYYL